TTKFRSRAGQDTESLFGLTLASFNLIFYNRSPQRCTLTSLKSDLQERDRMGVPIHAHPEEFQSLTKWGPEIATSRYGPAAVLCPPWPSPEHDSSTMYIVCPQEA